MRQAQEDIDEQYRYYQQLAGVERSVTGAEQPEAAKEVSS
jgi:hypothetical protein